MKVWWEDRKYVRDVDQSMHTIALLTFLLDMRHRWNSAHENIYVEGIEGQ